MICNDQSHNAMMKRLIIPLLTTLALTVTGVSMADENVFGLSAGMDYSTGKYGDEQSTDIIYSPVTARYETNSWIFKLTLPYVRITGPGNVIGGSDNVVQIGPTGGGVRRTASGQGDVVAAATRNVYQNPEQSFLLDITGKVKFGTADAIKGLGTGENDYSIQADLLRQNGAVLLFGSVGRKWMGDPAGIALRDPWFGSLGIGYNHSKMVQFGGAYDIRQRVTDSGARLSELMIYATYKSPSRYTVQCYVIKGYAAGSPDWGAGIAVGNSF